MAILGKLLEGIRLGRVQEVIDLLKVHAGLILEVDQSTGLTLLHRAAFHGQVPIATYLLNQGATQHIDIHPPHPTCNRDIPTALYMAALNGHPDMVHLLLTYDADPNLGTTNGTPLMVASFHGWVGVVRCLLKHQIARKGVNLANATGQTALWLACRKGRVEVVRELLRAGADVLMAPLDGPTAVGVAIAYGHGTCAQMLLEWQNNRRQRSSDYNDGTARRLQQHSSTTSLNTLPTHLPSSSSPPLHQVPPPTMGDVHQARHHQPPTRDCSEGPDSTSRHHPRKRSREEVEVDATVLLLARFRARSSSSSSSSSLSYGVQSPQPWSSSSSSSSSLPGYHHHDQLPLELSPPHYLIQQLSSSSSSIVSEGGSTTHLSHHRGDDYDYERYALHKKHYPLPHPPPRRRHQVEWLPAPAGSSSSKEANPAAPPLRTTQVWETVIL